MFTDATETLGIASRNAFDLSEQLCADALTKALCDEKFIRHRTTMSVQTIQKHQEELLPKKTALPF